MDAPPDRISIFAAADDAFARPMAAMLHSVVSTLRPGVRAHFTLCDGGFSRTNRQRMDSFLADLDCDVDWAEVDASRLEGANTTRRWPLQVYYRLMIPDLVASDVERTLYIDCDALAMDDVSKLWEVDLGDAFLGAVQDYGTTIDGTTIEVSGKYFNSGVLVFNVGRWREQGSVDGILEFLAQNQHRFEAYDQDALNAFFDGSWLELDPRWNVVTQVFQHSTLASPSWDAARDRPGIVHFTGPRTRKPWAYKARHPLTRVYLEHESHTPWAGHAPDYVTFARRVRGTIARLFTRRTRRGPSA